MRLFSYSPVALDFAGLGWRHDKSGNREDAGIIPVGSNWIAVAFTTWLTPVVGAGIQSDGSLWRLLDKPTGIQTIRLGTDTNWHSLTAGQKRFLALKNDGNS